MIVRLAMSAIIAIASGLINAIGVIPGIDVSFINNTVSFVSQVITSGAGFVFFLIRPATFYMALDVLIFIHFAEPIYYFVMWLLKKLPFCNIK